MQPYQVDKCKRSAWQIHVHNKTYLPSDIRLAAKSAFPSDSANASRAISGFSMRVEIITCGQEIGHVGAGRRERESGRHVHTVKGGNAMPPSVATRVRGLGWKQEVGEENISCVRGDCTVSGCYR